MRTRSSPYLRRRFSAAERAGLLRAYRESGLTQREFAMERGLGMSTLARWLGQERQGPVGMARGSSRTFAEVPLGQVLGTRWSAELVLPNGLTVRLAQAAPAEWLGQVLALC